MNGSRRWTAPGNLLIAGEYLVTDEGGMGISVAAGGRAVLQIEKAGNLTLTGMRGGVEIDDDSLQMAVRDFRESTPGQKSVPGAGLIVDTGVFFDDKGRKLGFGSSAAAALLFACGLQVADGKYSGTGSTSIDEIVRVALGAHRQWQGGRGSGYDILSSASGGAGLFTGGTVPARIRIPWPSHLEAWIVQGRESVGSSGAVRLYQHWKNEKEIRGEQAPFLGTMSRAVQTLAASLSNSGAETVDRLHELASLGVDLGNEIGVPAMPMLPGPFMSDDRPWYRPGRAAAKCLGAGDELILILSVPDGLSRKEQNTVKQLMEDGRAAPLRIETDGLRQETEQ